MELAYEAVVELDEEDGSFELPELPDDFFAYVRDKWTNKRIDVKTRGKTKLPEGTIRWSRGEELVEWSDVDESRYTLFIVRSYHGPAEVIEDDREA